MLTEVTCISLTCFLGAVHLLTEVTCSLIISHLMTKVTCLFYYKNIKVETPWKRSEIRSVKIDIESISNQCTNSQRRVSTPKTWNDFKTTKRSFKRTSTNSEEDNSVHISVLMLSVIIMILGLHLFHVYRCWWLSFNFHRFTPSAYLYCETKLILTLICFWNKHLLTKWKALIHQKEYTSEYWVHNVSLVHIRILST